MNWKITGSVGKAGVNNPEDVTTIQELLNQIPPAQGGPDPKLVKDGKIGEKTIAAIEGFQGKALGFNWPDGRVDMDGKTFKELVKMVQNLLAPGGSGGTASSISIRQVNPPELTAAHEVTNPVLSPLMLGDKFQEQDLTTIIHEYLFEVNKGGRIFWVGAAVPQGTADFTRAQVFFHPTVIQAGQVHASDTDYPSFAGGWSGTIQRYVAMEGGQLAGARMLPLLVPFTTMGALAKPSLNMFSDKPVETLNTIMAAIQQELSLNTGLLPILAQVGVSSFSSGITAMRLFIKDLQPSGLIKEVIDFDSPFIISEPKTLTPSSGALSKCYTQIVLTNPPSGWVNMPVANFSNITSFSSAHAIIGWMTYNMAMLGSIIL